ncbi:MAG: hypothetical protein P8Y60_13070 [Calditrichota bacterium]
MNLYHRGLTITLFYGLAACTNGIGSIGITAGQFIDSAVGGLTYTCSSGTSGVTDNNGLYICNTGDTVTFSINGFVIGSTIAADILTPNSLGSNNEQALNIAQLLQTLDIDNNPSNGINIARYGIQYDAMATMANDNISLGQGDFDTTVAIYINETLVDEAAAQTHLNDTISSMSFNATTIKSAMAGQTLYPAKPTPADSEEWIVASDGLTATGSGVDSNGPYSGNLEINYTDSSFTVISDNPEDGPVTFTVTAITTNYIDTSLGKIYYAQQEAYIDAMIEAVSGKKVYPQQSSLSYAQEWSFDSSGTSAIVSGVDQFGAFTDHIIVTYSGANFTVTNNDPGDADYGTSSTFTVLDITTNHIQVEDSSANQFAIFYTQQEAYGGL